MRASIISINFNLFFFLCLGTSIFPLPSSSAPFRLFLGLSQNDLFLFAVNDHVRKNVCHSLCAAAIVMWLDLLGHLLGCLILCMASHMSVQYKYPYNWHIMTIKVPIYNDMVTVIDSSRCLDLKKTDDRNARILIVCPIRGWDFTIGTKQNQTMPGNGVYKNLSKWINFGSLKTRKWR